MIRYSLRRASPFPATSLEELKKYIYFLQLAPKRGVVVVGAAFGLVPYGLIILFHATVEYLLMVENSVSCVRVGLPVLAIFTSPLRPVAKFNDLAMSCCSCVCYANSELKRTLRV